MIRTSFFTVNSKRNCWSAVGAAHLFILLLSSSLLFAQSYQVRNYTEDDGLASPEVFAATQDLSGCMWFATRTGISVYDGSNWQTYANSGGLPAGVYSEIARDSEGTIWTVSPSPGLRIAYYTRRGDRWTLLPVPAVPYSSRKTLSFAVSAASGQPIVVLGTQGLGLFLWSGNEWEHIDVKKGLVSSSINHITAGGDGFYIATDRGISVLKDGKIDNSLNEKLNLPSPGVINIAGDNSTTYLLGEKWLGCLKNGIFKTVVRGIDLTCVDCDSFLLPDHDGRVFFGNLHGVFLFDNSSGATRYLGEEQGLIAVGATGAYMDRERNIWLTGLRGVNKITGMRFANYRKINGLLADETSAICEVEPGRFILGHQNGLTFFDLNNNRFKRMAFKGGDIKKNIDPRVLDIRCDREGNAYVAASHLGLARININANKLTRWYGTKEGLPGKVSSVYVDKSGVLWAGTSEGVFRLRAGKFGKIEPPKGTADISARRLFPGPGNSIYIANYRTGIYLLENNKLRHFMRTRDAYAYADNVYAILTDSRGTLWAGTKGGLYIGKNGSLIKFNEQGHRIDRPVYFITEDHKQRLWFGTDNGVIRWDGRDWNIYTIHQGLAGRETNRAAGIVDHRGRVWIGTDRGLSCYREEFEKGDIPPPVVELLSLEVSGKHMPLQTANKLKHDWNNVIFNYRAVSFIDEDALRCRTKLEGFDRDWSAEKKPDSRQAIYTNLPPGHYRFQVKARNAEGLWSAVCSSAPIIIKRPFWRRWWFHLLIVLTIGAAVFGIQKYITKRRYAIALEKQVRDKTEELQKAHDELEIRVEERTRELAESNEELFKEIAERKKMAMEIKAALREKEVLLKEIHHRVKNNLQVIISLLGLQAKYIEDEKAVDVFKNSRERVRAMALVHEKLYGSKNLSKINFREYIESLLGNLFGSYSLKPGQVDLTSEIEDIALDIGTSIPLGLIINELVSNALKHAFKDRDNGKLLVSLQANKDEREEYDYLLTVGDNGVGFPEDVDFRANDTLGMLLINSLVKQLRGTLNLDRKNGTTFTLKFKKRMMDSSYIEKPEE